MFNPTLLWLLLLPVGCGLGLWYALKDDSRGLIAGGATIVVGALLLVIAFAASKGVATADTEIWNGQITAKDRLHGTYEESYKCHCRNVTTYSGSGKNRTSSTTEVCDTCYRTHYTVKWEYSATIGGGTIDTADWTNAGVYALPNPQRWSIIQVGDPASRQHSYTNYVQAVPQSLFTPTSATLKAQFASLTLPYPDKVYDFYHNDHFVTPGWAPMDAAAWNDSIARMLRELGPKKQVNAIVVIAKTDDPNYEYAIRDAWEGCNKNDVVLLIGSKTWPKIDFVRVISWTKNELFKVELRDTILAQGVIAREPIVNAFGAQIAKNFERRHMSEFKYLEAEIDPPTWVLITVAVLILLGAVGTWGVMSGYFDSLSRRRIR